tara:strand:- start:3227 stop:5320 length:2094 start_codon:yes stop_codon:yes gene_type:complete
MNNKKTTRKKQIIAAVDIGGTFTDIVVYDNSNKKTFLRKELTTTIDPSIGALAGLRSLIENEKIRFQDLSKIIHATTLAGNAIIERKGAETGLVATKGFGEILTIGRESRYDIYDLNPEFPEPLVKGSLRHELTERTSASGQVLQIPSVQEIKVNIQELVDKGAESIAVCLLHSYVNSENEREIGKVIEKSFPELSYSLSSDVCPEIREYERTSTTVANAYIKPLIARYLENLEINLSNVSLYIMLSNGGITDPTSAEKNPIRMFESGPAASVLSAKHFGKNAGLENFISFDMGGTTAKTSIIEKGDPHISFQSEVARVKRFNKGSGLPIQNPCIDLLEVGAGGGSIAQINKMGLLKVGPESTGANPGPACYDIGGEEPTVTDADLLLGYINPEFFLGGEMLIKKEKSEQVIETKIAKPLKIETIDAAWGIHELVNERMASAVKMQISQRGLDHRNFTLFASGGAGPVHAFRLARKVGLQKIICPPASSLSSSLGMLTVPLKVDSVYTMVTPLDEVDLKQINKLLEEKEKECFQLLSKSGENNKKIRIQRLADISFEGQGSSISVQIPDGKLTQNHFDEIEMNFREKYISEHGSAIEKVKLQVFSWRIFAYGEEPKMDFEFMYKKNTSKNMPIKSQRRIYLPETKGFRKVNVYDRYQLKPGQIYKGPALLEEPMTTTVIGPRSRFTMDKKYNVTITL